MVTLIQAATRLEAWMRGTEHLLDHDTVLNLVLEITFPTHGPNDHVAAARIDEFLATEGQIPTHSVAETIFPGPSTSGAVSVGSSKRIRSKSTGNVPEAVDLM